MSKCILEWDKIEHDTIELAQKIKEKNISFKGMVVVSRGGMGVAALLSRLLDIKLVDIICIESYNDENNTQQAEIKLIKPASLAEADLGEGWLVVDDLIDTGLSYDLTLQRMPKAVFACLYSKSKKFKDSHNTIFVKFYPESTWISFPWETLCENK